MPSILFSPANANHGLRALLKSIRHGDHAPVLSRQRDRIGQSHRANSQRKYILLPEREILDDCNEIKGYQPDVQRAVGSGTQGFQLSVVNLTSFVQEVKVQASDMVVDKAFQYA